MSDVSQGPGWWLASDGKWYPPESAPAAQEAREAPTASDFLHRVARPESMKKGVHAALGALESSGLAKVDRESGQIKMKKFGVAKAAFRPRKTIRKAISGATGDLVRSDKPTDTKKPPENSP